MTTRRLLIVAACVPFLLADSCVKAVYVLYEYRLDHCPATGFELPQNVRFAGWELSAEEGVPYCHGFLRYALEEEKDAELFSEPIKGGFVYARFVPREASQLGACTLQLITNLACNPRESVADCEARMPYHGVRRATRATAKDDTDVVAQRLIIGQKLAPKLPAESEKIIGRQEALEDWCGKL